MVGRHEKLLERFMRRPQPKDFRWRELLRLLGGFGYTMKKPGKTAGSARQFIHDSLPPITLHEPHPGNIVKLRAMKEVLNTLKESGLI